jgi:hypothetical protein
VVARMRPEVTGTAKTGRGPAVVEVNTFAEAVGHLLLGEPPDRLHETSCPWCLGNLFVRGRMLRRGMREWGGPFMLICPRCPGAGPHELPMSGHNRKEVSLAMSDQRRPQGTPAEGWDPGGSGHGPAAPEGGHRAEHPDHNTGEGEPANRTALARQTAPP